MRVFSMSLLVVTVWSQSWAAEEDLALPKAIGDLKYEKRTDYEPKELGYSLRYSGGELLKADVYIYSRGVKNLHDGIESPEVQKEMSDVINTLRQLEKLGKYRDVTEVSRGERGFDDSKTKFLWARRRYRQAPGTGVVYTGPRISDTYLLAHHGKFLKIRITTNELDLEKHDPQIERFVQELARLVERSE